MKKRFISAALALCLSLLIAVPAFADGSNSGTDGNYTWSVSISNYKCTQQVNSKNGGYPVGSGRYMTRLDTASTNVTGTSYPSYWIGGANWAPARGYGDKAWVKYGNYPEICAYN